MTTILAITVVIIVLTPIHCHASPQKLLVQGTRF
jgi:hypothetical protein